MFVPYVELGMSDYAERREKETAELMKVDPCKVDPAALKRMDARGKPEKWNIPGRAAWPDSADFARRAFHRILDRELTLVILRLKRGEDLPNPVPSTACAGESWRYRRAEDGSLREVELSRRIFEPLHEKSWELPLRYESGRREGS